MLRIRRISLYLLLVYVVLVAAGSHLMWNYQYDQLLTEHQAQLDRFAGHIESKLDKYAHLPRLLAKDREVVSALLLPDNSAQLDITNRYLEQVNQTIQAADTYLLDLTGTTIAASNWNIGRSFVGRNFSWRPYFYEALEGKSSQYFALGSTSGQRGYYYSYPVIYAAEVLGVIVVKMDLSAIEANWTSQSSYFVATDDHNVVFMSSNPDWLFKSLTTLSEAERLAIFNSRQYLNTPIRSLGLRGEVDQPVTELVNPHRGWIQGDYITSSRRLSALSLTIRVLTPKSEVFWPVFGFVLVLALVFVVIYLGTLLVHSRQQRQRQFEQLQAEAKQKLEFLVMERTAELHIEIDERIRAEEALRQTQDELIQAAKLAVLGQMSASISHELNNPLAAIRSFADNGRRFLTKQQYHRVDENLERISNLTDRMAKISEQLKSFSRKSDQDDQVETSLESIVHSTLELLAPQLKSKQVHLELAPFSHPVKVLVNPIRLEQVLINIIANAIQALSDQEQPRMIQIAQVPGNNQVIIHIDDNGPGISGEKKEKLFEPFYTTKKNGLGLGMSISQQIIAAMNGQLSVDSSPLGGARFSVILPLAQQES
ncbi:sensor histidine kinase [Vibrio sp.]|uniref:sensor histidine kinase n=1 Tax=Vibrio sp. TaxID=678 RepID=UPI003D0C563B